MRWIPFATKQRPLNDFHLGIEMYFHVQGVEDKTRCPVIITTAVVMVMMMNWRLLLFLVSWASEFCFFPPQSFQECLSCVSSCPILFWHFCRGAVRRGERRKDPEADLGLGLACWLQTAPRLPPPLCLSLCCTQGHHWSVCWALYSSSLGRAFREIDCSQFPADWGTSTFVLVPPMSPLTPLF